MAASQAMSALSDLIARHRAFPDARWAMGANTLARLDEIAERIEPNSSPSVTRAFSSGTRTCPASTPATTTRGNRRSRRHARTLWTTRWTARA